MDVDGSGVVADRDNRIAPVKEAGQSMPSLRPCPSCNRSVSPAASACPGCGHPFSTAKPKDPGIAGLLSFLIPGLGTMYAGKVGSGIVVFVLWLGAWFYFLASLQGGVPLVTGIILLAVYGAGIWDAVWTVRKHNGSPAVG
ncbi:MAG: hypothetical protein ACYDBQ_02470 [Thermoplasmatota archaeon]